MWRVSSFGFQVSSAESLKDHAENASNETQADFVGTVFSAHFQQNRSRNLQMAPDAT